MQSKGNGNSELSARLEQAGVGNGTPSLGKDLGAILKGHLAELGLRNQDELTVMAPQRDPYRQERFRAQAEWFAEQVAKMPHLRVHVRGVHYAAIDTIKPDGTPLPSSPLKEGEKRAGAWEREFGIEQVELDAIATLRPDVLEEIAIAGIRPYFDSSLDRRVREARQEWERAAQQVLEDQLGPDVLERIRADVESKLAGLKEQVTEIKEQLWVPTDDLELPEIPEIPEPAPKDNGTLLPLVGSEMGHIEFVRTLKARSAYTKK